MSFFVNMPNCFKNFPAVNAEIEGQDNLQELLQYKLAVGTDKGLVVSVLKTQMNYLLQT